MHTKTVFLMLMGVICDVERGFSGVAGRNQVMVNALEELFHGLRSSGVALKQSPRGAGFVRACTLPIAECSDTGIQRWVGGEQ